MKVRNAKDMEKEHSQGMQKSITIRRVTTMNHFGNVFVIIYNKETQRKTPPLMIDNVMIEGQGS